MPLPRAVIEQAERAERAHLELLGKTEEGNQPTAPEVKEETPANEQKPADEPTQKVEAPEEKKPVVETPAAATDPWELKYRVLNGKYNAEVPRLAAEVRDLKAQLEAALAQKTAEAPATPEPDVSSVAEQYGEDFANAVKTVASAETKRLRDELASEVKQMRDSDAKRTRNDFMRDLASAVPDWQTIDQDPGFTAFLDEFDPLTGRTRREFFNEADAANDANRVASYFVTYSRASTPRAKSEVDEKPAAPSVEHLIAPDSSRSVEAPRGKKQWTTKEINKFYDDARRGLYKAADFERIDSDITAAISEGRIRGG